MRYIKIIGITLATLFIVLALIVGGGWLWLVNKSHHAYITSPAGPIKIPDEIVKEHDCVKYKAFVESLIRPGFVPDVSCPWAKVGPIGHFVINGVKLDVPRGLLGVDKNQADGNTSDLWLLVEYPQMAAYKDEDKTLSILMTDVKRFQICNFQDICYHQLQHQFLRNSSIQEYLDDPVKYIRYKPELIGHNDQLGLDLYRNSGGLDLFVKGDIYTPDYWLTCLKEFPDREAYDPGCEGGFVYQGRIYVKYSFRRRMFLNENTSVHKAIVKLIESFDQGAKYD